MANSSPAARRSILLVEDEADLAASVRYSLEKEGGYQVTVASTGETGLALARQKSFDLILLDLMLPGMDGVEVCRAVRALPGGSRVPVLMLTARVDEADKLVGLAVGADDYMTKPFSMKELLARVRAHLRRAEAARDRAGSSWQGEDLQVDFEAHVVVARGAEVTLTRMEFSLLATLIRSRGRVLTRDQLLEKVWGYHDHAGSRTVDVHVRRLRRKLGEAGRHIQTVFGVGYRFRESSEPGVDE